jgi:uncharacterized protein YdeI (YjbR/CyaY-like superfamily)
MAHDGKREQIESREAWRAWLEINHEREERVWLVMFKKHTGERYVSYDEVVEEALCFGWIDSMPQKLDKDRSMRWMSPRKAGSGWSRVNMERIEKMISAGFMTPAGLAKKDTQYDCRKFLLPSM